MQSASTFALLASSLVLASALPTEKRTSSIVCYPERKYSGTLLVQDSSNTYSAGFTSLTAKDSKGIQSKVLITKQDDGSVIADQTFDFIPCSSTFMGYNAFNNFPTTAPTEEEKREIAPITAPVATSGSVVYGHLALGGSTTNCLQTKTGSVRGSTVLTNSACSQNDDKSQIQNFWTYDINANEIKFVGSKSSGPHHPVSLSLSSVNHRAVKLNPVDNANGAYLSLGREILL